MTRIRRVRTFLKRRMWGVVLILALTISGVASVRKQPQDKQAKKLANKVAIAFSYGLAKLDSAKLLNGPLKLTIENSGGEVEFEHKSFRNWAAMERYMKSQSNEPGFPIRTSGDKKLSCRRGLCRLDLVDNQMAHNRVFLTKVYYGYTKGRIYVKKLYIIFG